MAWRVFSLRGRPEVRFNDPVADPDAARDARVLGAFDTSHSHPKKADGMDETPSAGDQFKIKRKLSFRNYIYKKFFRKKCERSSRCQSGNRVDAEGQSLADCV